MDKAYGLWEMTGPDMEYMHAYVYRLGQHVVCILSIDLGTRHGHMWYAYGA